MNKKGYQRLLALLCVFAIVFTMVHAAFADGEENPVPDTADNQNREIEVVVVDAAPSYSAPASEAPAPAVEAPAPAVEASTPASEAPAPAVEASTAESVFASSALMAGKSAPASEPSLATADAVPAAGQSEIESGSSEGNNQPDEPKEGENAENTRGSSEENINNGPSEDLDRTSTGLLIDRPQQSDEILTTVGTNEEQGNTYDSQVDSYNVFFDENTGKYRITYTISEETDAQELTIDFTKALETLAAYGGMSDSNVLEPGDSRVFEIFIQSDNGHTYKYDAGSFVLTTPDAPLPPSGEEEPLPSAGDRQTFDEQTINNENIYVELTTKFPAFREALIQSGISEYDIDHNLVRPGDVSAFLGNNSQENLEQLIINYYSDKDGKEYHNIHEVFNESEQAVMDILASSTNTAGNRTILSYPEVIDAVTLYDNMYNKIMYVVYGEEDVKSALGNNGAPKEDTIYTTVKTVYSVIDYDDMTEYPECYPAYELGPSYVRWLARYGLPEDTLVSADGSAGFLTENGEIATASNTAPKGTVITSQVEYQNSDWRENEDETIRKATVGEYMKGEEIWTKADAYFTTLLGNGISESEATQMTREMVSFLMATNINFDLAGNNYQNTEWGYHNTIKLVRTDGELNLKKIEGEEAGAKAVEEMGDKAAIGSEPETDPNETTFQLWYYKDENVDEKYYYTSQQQTTINEAGEETTSTTYGFVKYDPESKGMTYTIDTTGGELHIDYAMLEGIIYYLQETIAPEGYVLDTTVYIICDTEETIEQAKMLLAQDTDEALQATLKKDKDGNILSVSYVGSIDSGKPLNIEFVNVKMPDTNPEPTPNPQPPVPVNPVFPEPPVPAQAGDLEIEDYMTPLAGGLNMNEGDCLN